MELLINIFNFIYLFLGVVVVAMLIIACWYLAATLLSLAFYE